MNHLTKTQLEVFLEAYPSTRVNYYQDSLVYKVRDGRAKKWADEANKLILSLGLDLVAIASPYNDSFMVKSSLTFDI